MAMGGRSVFISYRRQLSESLALLVRKDLSQHRFDIFMDIKNLNSGTFEPTILSEIKAREHFIVVLEPGSLDQIGEDGDWLRREIAYALDHSRNVVPVTANGFEFRRDLVLPPDVARLPSLNALPIERGYFDEAMEVLRTRFLKVPSKPWAKVLSKPWAKVLSKPWVRFRLETPSFEYNPYALASWSARVPVLPAPLLAGRVGKRFRIKLNWSEVSGADEYVLERAPWGSVRGGDRLRVRTEDPLGSFQEVYRGPDRSHNDVPEPNWEVEGWRYRVCASASGKAGMWSDALEVDDRRRQIEPRARHLTAGRGFPRRHQQVGGWHSETDVESAPSQVSDAEHPDWTFAQG